MAVTGDYTMIEGQSFNIKVIDDCAWLICDNNWDFEYECTPMTDSEIQFTFLEKIDNDWMISFNAIVAKPGPKRE